MTNNFKFMIEAIRAATNAPSSDKAFSVGAVIVLGDEIVCTGHSRELAENMHAEEVCLAKLSKMNLDHTKLVMYSTMEPCGERLSGKNCCANLIIDSKIPSVVVGCLEPDTFIKSTQGIQKLKSNNIQVTLLPELQGICV
jgi:pyrimidine deaminase RibD-like protein